MPSTDKSIVLECAQPFASGGNRLCFRHPKNLERCLKVIRPDRTPAIRRAEKSFPANLRPLSLYDENRVEADVLQYLHRNYPESVTQHLPHSFGLVQTDLGMAHETELIHDSDGLIAQTLEQYIWENGLNTIAEQAIQTFKDNWSAKPPSTRDWIPHNFVIQRKGQNAHLMLIDGFGKKPRIKLPFANHWARSRLHRRLQDFDRRIQLIIERKATNNGPMHRINNLNRQA